MRVDIAVRNADRELSYDAVSEQWQLRIGDQLVCSRDKTEIENALDRLDAMEEYCGG